MLRIENITKTYETSSMKVEALRGVSVNFRKNEFVAVLGPSGCGKTTLLNIIGGLDQYTSGDLFILGRSTKEFSARDWDVYRNHRIGFVFQSYNLIPHQNVLQNVELALTIAGLGPKERVEKARVALDKVGLQGMYKKMPNELSGGQCQRVAIARALVNEPDILLADEPTGALDSVTSIQIMDLIREIAKEKLVIMVTHNPDLADQYATRVISLHDGLIIGDTNPYSTEEEKAEFAGQETEIAANMAQEKAKMSLFTAFRLSARNLLSKVKRTTLTVIAASIGIVGVSAVLSVSNGVTTHIQSIQDDMLSGNPVTISRSSLDFNSLLNSVSTGDQAKIVADGTKDGYVNVRYMIEELVKTASITQNSLITNKISPEYDGFLRAMPEEYYSDMSRYYGILMANSIYVDSDIDEAEDYDGTGKYSLSFLSQLASSIIRHTDYSNYADLVDTYAKPFVQSLSNEDYVLSQYDVVTGKFAEAEDELMVVLDKNGQMQDFALTLLGIMSQNEFLTAINKYANDPEYPYDPELFRTKYPFETFLNKEYNFYPNDEIFTPSAELTALYAEVISHTGEWTEADIAAAAAKLWGILYGGRAFYYDHDVQSDWTSGRKLKVVGILKPKAGVQYGSLNTGLYYTPAFTKRFMTENKGSQISQLMMVLDFLGIETGLPSQVSFDQTGAFDPTASYGIYYDFKYHLKFREFDTDITDYAVVGATNSTTSLLSLISSIMPGGSSTGRSRIATLDLADVAGNHVATGFNLLQEDSWTAVPSSVSIYPKSFNDKYLVTDYLDKWNKEGDVEVLYEDGTKEVITYEEREDNPIKYTDNLEIVIRMINTVIMIVTIALVAFTSLSLVVSTVMIAIITYVSVMERIKEIGIIRALGGRKRDVSNLFNAETFMIGLISGVFGISVTYLFELVLNVALSGVIGVAMIANLQWWVALIVIGVSVALTMIAGIIPASSAARKDPVVALRTE